MRSEIGNFERSEETVDAFTAEVIRSAVVAITGEMKTNLMRTAYHTIIYEAEDFTVGLFDADGNTISIGLGLPSEPGIIVPSRISSRSRSKKTM